MKFQISPRYLGLAVVILLGVLVIGYVLSTNPETSLPQTESNPDAAHQQVNISAVYMKIVNTGTSPQKLASATSAGIDLVSLYRNPSLETEESGLTLYPHQQVELTSETLFLMLYGVNDDLQVGDKLTVTLHFESGDVIDVDVPVQFEVSGNSAPAVQVMASFQVTNAYAVPTVFGSADDNMLTTGYDWHLPAGFPLPIVPADNPMSEEKFQLGRYLFYDKQLSGNSTQACATCHLQELAFTDGVAVPVGSTGKLLPRSSQSLVNVAYNPTYTWANPTLTRIERQVLIPMFGEFPVELGMTGYEDEILNRFREDGRYQDQFAQAFPDDADPFSIGNIQLALGTFVRGIISADSPYDRYVFDGDKSALSASAVRGMDLFFGERFECHHCHGGFNFSDSTVHAASVFIETPFHNTGLYNIDGAGAFPPNNQGVFAITGNTDDMGRFRAPSLRNIALTAPYMHDGSLATLADVLQFYADGGRVIASGAYAGDGRQNPHKSGFVAGFEIADQEVEDIIHFLESLTDESLTTNPRFSNPFRENAE